MPKIDTLTLKCYDKKKKETTAMMISITTDGMLLSSEPMTAQNYINATLVTQLNIFNNIVDNAPDEDKQKIKEELYDIYNAAASAFLEAFAPDIELRPDLTAEAIMEKENEIIDRKVVEFRGGSNTDKE